jgi:hypothetical protein
MKASGFSDGRVARLSSGGEAAVVFEVSAH